MSKKNPKTAPIAGALAALIVLASCMPGTSQGVTPTVAKPTATLTLKAPTATETVTPTRTATPTPQTPVPGTILFEEDFEDDVVQGLNYLIGSWEIVTDETGNKVFEADNRFEPEALSFGFGSPEWSDYAVDYDVRLRSPAASFCLFFRDSRQGHYGQNLTVLYEGMGLVVSDAEGNWWQIESRSYAFGRGVWYHVRVEAQGPMLRAFINGELHVEMTDSQFSAGEASFERLAGRVQLDNIRVTVLPPYNAEEDLYQENLKGGATGVPLSPDGN